MDQYKLVRYEEERCADPEHEHVDGLLQMARFEILGRVFDVTQDGDSYNVRSDGQSEVEDVSERGVFAYMFDVILGRGR